MMVNIFVEPQYSVLRHGDGQVEWGSRGELPVPPLATDDA